jgi:hypothetical protein
VFFPFPIQRSALPNSRCAALDEIAAFAELERILDTSAKRYVVLAIFYSMSGTIQR